MADDVDGELAPHRDESGIGAAVDLLHGFDAGNAAELLALGMDGPDLASEAQSASALDGNVAFMAADEGDGFGREEAGEGCGHCFFSYGDTTRPPSLTPPRKGAGNPSLNSPLWGGSARRD